MFVIFVKKIIMSRPKRNRIVNNMPSMLGFKPFGVLCTEIEKIILHYDEYESIIYCDYDGLTQEVAADKMGVSRPTYTRIYESARKKIAKSFKEGLIIIIEGGNVEFKNDWYKCKKCFKLIQGIENHIKCENCTSYCVEELVKLNNNTFEQNS